MANWQGHSTAATMCGLVGAVFLPPELKQYSEVVIVAGIAGGIAPDVDLGGKNMSIPNTLFKIASLIAFWSAFSGLQVIHQALWSISLFAAFWLVADWSMSHRGVTHSWFGALCSGLIVSYFAVQVSSPEIAIYSFWVAFMAHIQHLFIDDISSALNAINKNKSSRLALVSIRPITLRKTKELLFVSALVFVFGINFYNSISIML